MYWPLGKVCRLEMTGRGFGVNPRGACDGVAVVYIKTSCSEISNCSPLASTFPFVPMCKCIHKLTIMWIVLLCK